MLQDDGVIFLWVTGRAMELGRECLDIWGYRFVQVATRSPRISTPRAPSLALSLPSSPLGHALSLDFSRRVPASARPSHRPLISLYDIGSVAEPKALTIPPTLKFENI